MCLPEETLSGALVFLQLSRQKLQSDLTLEPCVFCPVDFAHTAFAEFGGDFVVGDLSADH